MKRDKINIKCLKNRFVVKIMKKMQFVLCELLFLCYTTTDNNHGGICVVFEWHMSTL